MAAMFRELEKMSQFVSPLAVLPVSCSNFSHTHFRFPFYCIKDRCCEGESRPRIRDKEGSTENKRFARDRPGSCGQRFHRTIADGEREHTRK